MEYWFHLNNHVGVLCRIIKETIRSKPLELKLGVPQESIAGPIFFIMYINDFIENSQLNTNEVSIVNYAADSNLLLVKTLWPELRQLLEEVFQQAEIWFEENNLILNKNKTGFVLFHPINSGILLPESILLQNEEYTLSGSVRFLGLYVDEELNWNMHIQQLCNKIGSSVYALRVLSKYVDTITLRTAYYGTIESQLRFGITFYGSGNMSSLFILQKKAVRIICNLKFRESCRGFFKQKGILTIYGIYIQECLLFFHKNQVMFSKYKNLKKAYNTRTSSYNLPKYRLTTSQKQMQYRCLKLFNSLPAVIQRESNFELFKRKIFKLLLNLEPYCLDDFMN